MILEPLQMEEDSITEGNLPHLSERQDHEVVISLTEKNMRPKALKYNFKLAELRLQMPKILHANSLECQRSYTPIALRLDD